MLIPSPVRCGHKQAAPASAGLVRAGDFLKNGNPNVTKKIKGNPQLLLRVPPELQKPLADEATKTGESRQGVLWRIAAKYFKGRKA